jgi:hypothetical protein
MIRAVLRKGRIEPLDALPKHWHDGLQLTVEGGEPSDDPKEIKKWYERLQALSAEIPAEEHKRMSDALAEQDQLAKKWMRRELGLNRPQDRPRFRRHLHGAAPQGTSPVPS